jgi:hypothetical protein
MWRLVVIAAIGAFAGGCSELLGITDISAADGSAADGRGDLGDGLSTADRRVDANNFCDRALWKATASVRGDGPGPNGGIDGDLNTRWNNQRFQDGNDWYQVDFGGPVKLTNITLDNTKIYPTDFPGRYEVYGSSDGTTFDSAAFTSGSGTLTTTVINFSQRVVRAVKIKQVGTSNSAHWFGICEFQITCQP